MYPSEPTYAGSSVNKLRALSVDVRASTEVRQAATRLSSNVRYQFSKTFTSDPLADAEIIISYVKKTLKKLT